MTTKTAWFIAILWFVCCTILYTTYGQDARWFWGSWAALAAIIAGWAVGRRINARRAAVFVLPLIVAAALVPLDRPASAATYPAGCAYVYRNVAINRAGFTIANINTQMRLCQGSGGNPTQSTYVSAQVNETSWGNTFGYTFGIDRIAADPYWAGHRGFKVTGWARGCIVKVVPLCYPTQTWQVYLYAVGGIASPATAPWPRQTGSALCTNNWCSYTGFWNGILLVGLTFDPQTWFSGPVHVS